MKILITGITGLLGSELAKILVDNNEVVGLSKNQKAPGLKVFEADISQQLKTYEIISKINPDIVIHCASMTDVDGCEKDPDLAYRVNAIGTRNVAVACQRFDTVLCSISTDYVFSGINPPKDGYSEFDTPNPRSIYARSKFAGEEYVRSLLNKYFIIRTSWLFGQARKNFVTQIAEALAGGKNVKVVDDMISSPTNVKDLSIALLGLINTQRFGTYHLCNGGFASRFEIARSIAGLVGAPETLIEKVHLKDLKLAAERPSFSGMNNYLWKLEGYAPLRTWQQSIQEFLAAQKYI